MEEYIVTMVALLPPLVAMAIKGTLHGMYISREEGAHPTTLPQLPW